MKQFITILFTFIFWTSINSYAQEHNHDNNEMDHGNHEMDKEKITLQSGSIDPNGILLTVAVEGMVCDFCAQAIQKVFLKKEEVAGITVDLDNQNVVIALKENKNITDNVIEDLFINAGYNVSEINREKL
ncbi:heavy-metal-associated domain-containing protein [Alphaproteobacteria bacterium]|jgi:thioredoxin-related protein|nr:heavy-metal-associated domain-containing protein [Alphaproteobacteria bacterium]|tara:strand:+ start:67 stop:456 length:390 start_codon:yes stop_codon:yes gene_type:complete